MTEKEAWGQAFENGRQQGDAEGYARGLREAVKHGRWEWLGPYRYNDEGMIGTCSVCKERLRLFAHKYCPNCGARMEGNDVY